MICRVSEAVFGLYWDKLSVGFYSNETQNGVEGTTVTIYHVRETREMLTKI
jgi:hypothetical protein